MKASGQVKLRKHNTNHFIEELDSDIGKSDIENIIDNLDGVGTHL